MTVLRIVADIATDDLEEMQRFYQDLFELDISMDLGCITTMSSSKVVSVRCDCPAWVMEWVIVSTIDSELLIVTEN